MLPLRRALVRTPTSDGDFTAAGWRIPDPVALLAEHEDFVALLESLGCHVEVAEPAPGLVDACYAHDPIVMTPYGAIILAMRKPIRAGEPAVMRADLDRLGIPVIGELTGDARSDGGDKVWLDERTLLLGRGHRTNAAAIAQIRAILEPRGVRVHVFDLPNYRGAAEVLHLMSVISPLAEDLAIVYSPLIPVALLDLLADRGIRTIDVDESEFATQGGNVLAARPGVVLVPAGNPIVSAAMTSAGCEVHEFTAPNACVAGDGGPTCLTQPLWRAG